MNLARITLNRILPAAGPILMVALLAGDQEVHANQASEITPPPSLVTAEAEGFLTPVLILEPQSWPVHIEYVTNYVPYFIVGNTTVAWHISDYNGKPLVFTTTVVVHDTKPPEFPSARDYVVGNSKNGKKTPVNFDIPSAVDIADPDVYVSSSHKSGSKFPVGNTTVVFTAMDDSGNTATHEMIVTVKHTKIDGLQLERTHDSIRATWSQFENRTGYGLVLLDVDTKKKIQDARIRGTSHTFSYLEPDTKYSVLVYVIDERYIQARVSTLTLPAPLLITDGFSNTDGWSTHYSKPFTFEIVTNEGNPEPSLKISKSSASRSYSTIVKSFDFEHPLQDTYVGIHYMIGPSEGAYGFLSVSGGDRQHYGAPLWSPSRNGVWHTSLNDATKYLSGVTSVKVGLALYSFVGGNHTVYFDNLSVSAVPLPNFRGGSVSESVLTPEQEHFNSVFRQILDGDLDPSLYTNGTHSLDHYNDFLLEVLATLPKDLG